jgi:hypothetical protein
LPNFKVSGAAGGAAFVLSLLLGLVSGSGLTALIRAGIFGALFFGLFCLIFWVLNRFAPELLSAPRDDLDLAEPGSHVNISVESGPLTGAVPMDNSERVDDITGRSPSSRRFPLDQKEDAGYNGNRGFPVVPESSAGRPGTGLFSEKHTAASLGGGALPAMDGSPASSGGSMDAMSVSVGGSGPRRPLNASKPPAMVEDFNPKELAQAIQTVLKRDEQG